MAWDLSQGLVNWCHQGSRVLLLSCSSVFTCGLHPCCLKMAALPQASSHVASRKKKRDVSKEEVANNKKAKLSQNSSVHTPWFLLARTGSHDHSVKWEFGENVLFSLEKLWTKELLCLQEAGQHRLRAENQKCLLWKEFKSVAKCTRGRVPSDCKVFTAYIEAGFRTCYVNLNSSSRLYTYNPGHRQVFILSIQSLCL